MSGYLISLASYILNWYMLPLFWGGPTVSTLSGEGGITVSGAGCTEEEKVNCYQHSGSEISLPASDEREVTRLSGAGKNTYIHIHIHTVYIETTLVKKTLQVIS